MEKILIVGAGAAGAHTAVALREQGATGPVTVLGEEPHPPYDRPPLSKDVLSGRAEDARFDIDFADLGVELLLGRRALALDPAARTVDTAEGPAPYDRLVVATGARPVHLPGTAGIPGVHLLRTLDDARALRGALLPGRRVVVVGAGWIGAETATVARELGCTVTVLEAAAEPLAGALPAELGARMRAWYAEAGAELRTGARVSGVERSAPDGPVSAVLLDGGTRLPADAVVIGVGVRPDTGWLDGSGVQLGPDGAVLADARLRTTAPGVWAVGDCASFPSARFGTRLLVNHWDNAMQGAQAAAASLLGEDAPPYDPVPYFWSEQFGRFVQYAGHHAGADAVLHRGGADDAAWTVLWLRGGRLVALLAVDRPRDLMQGRKLIAAGAEPVPERAADPAVPLKAAVAGGTGTRTRGGGVAR